MHAEKKKKRFHFPDLLRVFCETHHIIELTNAAILFLIYTSLSEKKKSESIDKVIHDNQIFSLFINSSSMPKISIIFIIQ
jgi:hypothetical protein